MSEIEKLKAEIMALQDQIKPKQDRLNELYRQENDAIESRINEANRGYGNFSLDELRFAAATRCECGAGMAYPKGWIDIHGAWYCSAILRGQGDREKAHTSPLPFAFYEIKSEDQPSANGATTRPI